MLSFGSFPEVSLAPARTKRDDARKLLARSLASTEDGYARKGIADLLALKCDRLPDSLEVKSKKGKISPISKET
jgi:hypothetical protein